MGAALQELGDGHALVLKNPLAHTDSFYFPLPVALVDGKIILLRQCPEYSADLVGKEVTRINGIPTADILSSLFQYTAADGGGTHFAEAFVRVNLIPFITLYFEGARFYTVSVAGNEIVPLRVEAIRTVRAGVQRYPMLGLASGAALRRGDNALHLRAADSIAILVVTTFSKGDKAFFREAFSQMKDAGTHRLVLDLRGNTGGHRGAAVALTKHLVDTSFGYSLVKPRAQDVRRYLNRQGRMYYALGKVRYALGGAMRSRQTPQGRAIRYRYSPVGAPFGGKVAVITDGFTFSSSTMVTSWLKQHNSDAVFVGSQAGGGYNGNWGGSFPRITLPRSGMVVQMPAYRLVLDETSPKRDGIMPDVPVRYSVEDLLSNRDTALDAALGAVSGKRWSSPNIHINQPVTR